MGGIRAPSCRRNTASRNADGLDPAVSERLGGIAVELRLRAGKTDAAVKIALRAAGTGSEEADDLLWFAKLLANNGHRDEAAKALERSVAGTPERLDLWLALAEAVALFRTLLEQPTKDMLLLRRAAECLLDAGHADEAQATLERMMRIRPQTSVDEQAKRWAHRRLAEVLLREGTFSDAEPERDVTAATLAADLFSPADRERLDYVAPRLGITLR